VQTRPTKVTDKDLSQWAITNTTANEHLILIWDVLWVNIQQSILQCMQCVQGDKKINNMWPTESCN